MYTYIRIHAQFIQDEFQKKLKHMSFLSVFKINYTTVHENMLEKKYFCHDKSNYKEIYNIIIIIYEELNNR